MTPTFSSAPRVPTVPVAVQFTKYFILGMSGQADHNGDGQVTLTELAPYRKETLTDYVRRYDGREQVAQINPATR